MEQATDRSGLIAASSKHFARLLLTISENRLELLVVEMQEERERLLRAILLGLGVATLGLLAGISLTAWIVVLLWEVSPVAVLVVMILLHGGTAALFWQRLTTMTRDWDSFPATLDQLRKDCACLQKTLV